MANKLCPESLWKVFQERLSIPNHNARSDRDLHIPKLNPEFTKGGYHYSRIKALNAFQLILEHHYACLNTSEKAFDEPCKPPQERIPGRSDLLSYYISIHSFSLQF